MCTWCIIVIYLAFNCVTGLDSNSYDYFGGGEGYISELGSDWGSIINGRINQPKCIDIPENLTLCKDIGYRKMRFPNLLDHDSVAEVEQQARSWVSLLGIRCHPDTQLFLCTLFSPVCLDRPIYPCRSLCEGVQAGCEQTMNWWGFPWPDMLKCDQFPEDSDLCIPQVNHDNAGNICHPCKQPSTYEGLVNNFCRADFVIKGKIRRMKVIQPDKLLILKKKKKLIKADDAIRMDKKNIDPSLKNGASCECDQAIAGKTPYIIMGNKVGDSYIVSFLTPWEKNKDFKRALRAMKKSDACKFALPETGTSSADENRPNKVKNKKGNRRKNKNKKKKKDRRRKQRKERRRKNGMGMHSSSNDTVVNTGR